VQCYRDPHRLRWLRGGVPPHMRWLVAAVVV
jgi:hypothetical protein